MATATDFAHSSDATTTVSTACRFEVQARVSINFETEHATNSADTENDPLQSPRGQRQLRHTMNAYRQTNNKSPLPPSSSRSTQQKNKNLTKNERALSQNMVQYKEQGKPRLGRHGVGQEERGVIHYISRQQTNHLLCYQFQDFNHRQACRGPETHPSTTAECSTGRVLSTMLRQQVPRNPDTDL